MKKQNNAITAAQIANLKIRTSVRGGKQPAEEVRK